LISSVLNGEHRQIYNKMPRILDEKINKKSPEATRISILSSVIFPETMRTLCHEVSNLSCPG
jgi:hypothetical protein